MLSKAEINNLRAFMTRVADIKGTETIEHVRCMQALTREEQELDRTERNAKIAADAATRAQDAPDKPTEELVQAR